MSLKQSIVVVNEYTVKTGSKSGSRGGTPGDYVIRYMSRNGAVENVSPSRLRDTDDYIMKYMARESAVEHYNNVPEIKGHMHKAQKNGGVAFGYGDVSLSDEGLYAASKDIQRNFDAGHTVMKTVLSFDEDYLRENGILDEGFEFKKRGDFRGHIDQMKLRMAIMNGMSRMGKNYDDLQYVGVIQVDTAHVHCHLAMVDRGRGHVMPDGTQRGKLTAGDMKTLRRGIDTYLDRTKQIQMMSSSVMYDKRNAVCYIKKFTHKTMNRQGFPQFLLACLPDDRNLWRANSHSKDMHKANNLVREYVTELLGEPNSGYREAVASIETYARTRQAREGLTPQEYVKLVRTGQQSLLDDCVNAVYGVLKSVPKENMTVHTNMLDYMSMDYNDIAGKAVDDPMAEFGFKLRSYSSRMKYHRDEYHKYKDEHEHYESIENKAEDSKALGDYLKFEADYNAMLMVKYQYFLSFMPSEEGIEDEFDEIMKERETLENLRQMYDDKDIRRMKPKTAEDYGVRVYGQYGARRLVMGQANIIEERIRIAEENLKSHMNSFSDKLHDAGFDFDGHGVTRKKMYEFEDVKSLDLHHLSYDFPYDASVSKINADSFVEMANKRHDMFMAAKDYLIGTGQEDKVSELPEKDVILMKKYSDRISSNPTIESSRPDAGEFKRRHTIPLGHDYTSNINIMIRETIESVKQMEYQ